MPTQSSNPLIVTAADVAANDATFTGVRRIKVINWDGGATGDSYIVRERFRDGTLGRIVSRRTWGVDDPVPLHVGDFQLGTGFQVTSLMAGELQFYEKTSS